MQTVLAIAPDGGAAVKVRDQRRAQNIEGRGYDPFDDTWHWTGREPYKPAAGKGYILQEKAEDWTPKDAEELKRILRPDLTLRLTKEADETIAQAIARLPREHRYLMAVAAARVILRNLTNNIATFTFEDGSQACVTPEDMDVRPV